MSKPVIYAIPSKNSFNFIAGKKYKVIRVYPPKNLFIVKSEISEEAYCAPTDCAHIEGDWEFELSDGTSIQVCELMEYFEHDSTDLFGICP